MASSASWYSNGSHLFMRVILIGLLHLCLRTIPSYLCLGDGDGSMVEGGCTESERRALLAIKGDIYDPDQWLSSWKGLDCCQWRGVDCDNTTGHVVKLDLRYPYDIDAQIEFGKLPRPSKVHPSLLDLMHLKYLDLSLNNFSGTPIPKFIGSLMHLVYLNLSNAQFSGSIPCELGNLSNLQFLDLHSGYDPYNSYNYYNNNYYHNNNNNNNYYYYYHYNNNSNNNNNNYSPYGRWFLHANNLLWLSRIYSLRHLDLSGMNLSRATNWLYEINLHPSLSELHLSDTNLPFIHHPLSHNNRTALKVLDLSQNYDINTTIAHLLFNISSSLVHLDLRSCDFFDKLLVVMGGLCNLQHLDLSFNQITRKIFQKLGNFSHLEYLDLSDNQITGDVSQMLAKLGRLKNLYLSYNNIHGEIPKKLGDLTNLKSFFMMENKISGTITRSIGNLIHLQMLDLSGNMINGEIPESIGNLVHLQMLDLSDNMINGEIPGIFDKLHNLQELYLSHNHIIGKIPRSIGNLCNLNSLDISENNISGEIVDIIESWSKCIGYKLDGGSSLSGLRILNVNQNNLSGRLPTSLRGQQYIYIDMSSNNFHGLLPEWDLSSLNSINLSNNSFEGPIPLSFAKAMRLQFLSLSNNYINGSILPFICNLTNLVILDLSNNELSGGLPNCWHKSQLGIVNSQKDGMSGNSQSSTAGPIYLQSLHMRNNSLSGGLPLFLRYCKQLAVLNLSENKFSGNLPKWIGESLTSLRVLSVRSNFFKGNIPKQLSYLTSLQVLDLACNNFSGALPLSFGNFNAMMTMEDMGKPFSTNSMTFYMENILMTIKGVEMEYTSVLSLMISIDLSENNLSGIFPKELVNLRGLRFLNLSNNHFTGKIPENIDAWEKLESLDLSVNNLSGMIPWSISSMYSLRKLNLSHNNLSGVIPQGNQLQIFCDHSIYDGNPDLEEWPLPWCFNNASSTSPFQPRSQEEEHEPKIMWFYLSFVLGFAVGLWGFIYAVMIMQKVSVAYFRFIDEAYDWIYVQLVVSCAKLKRIMLSNDQG